MSFLAENDKRPTSAAANRTTSGLKTYQGYGVTPGAGGFKAPAASSFNDIPSLTHALHTNQITVPQYLARSKEIIKQGTPRAYSVGNTFSALGGAVNKVLIKPAVNTAKMPFDYASLGAAAATHNKKAGAKAGAALTNAALGSFISPLAQTAVFAGTTAASRNILNSKKLNAQEKTAIAKNVLNPAYNKVGFDLRDTRKQVVGKAFSLAAQDAASVYGVKAAGKGLVVQGGKRVVSPVVQGAKLLAGKDAEVNDLIAGTRLANALNNTRRASVAGKLAVDEARTTRIPVVTPLESRATRLSLGGTALENADRTRIPIKSVSTEVKGKVAKIDDATYIKKSNQLSKDYERESRQLASLPRSRAQQDLQQRLDDKYSQLHENLDTQAGKTNVAFTGKPKVLREPTTRSKPATSSQAPETVVNPKGEPSTSQLTRTAQEPRKVVTGDARVSGSAVRSEQRAVQAGLVKEFPDKATYEGRSYKQDAEDAVKLAHENPEEAKAIANGTKSGRSQAYNVAVRHAVEAKAKKEGDVETIMQLGNSSVHTKTSEAAQTLGAEGYNVDKNSPVEAIRQIAARRATTISKSLKKTPEKAIAGAVKEIKSEPGLKVSRQDWHSFVQDLRCK